MKESATDPDGDTVSYEWEGLREDGIYPLGKNIVRCKAVDTAGTEIGSNGCCIFCCGRNQWRRYGACRCGK